MTRPIFDWNPAAEAELTARWAAGETVGIIGAAMGCSKNAVIGKAHRLHLPPRPIPIVRNDGKPHDVRAPKLMTDRRVRALAELQERHRVAAEAKAARQAMQAKLDLVMPPPVLVPMPVAVPVETVPLPFGARQCCWPIGEPKDPGFRFCTGEAVRYKPYCERHASVAYTPRIIRREAA